MQVYTDKEIVELGIELLVDCGLLSQGDAKREDELDIKSLGSDGSTRRFWRISFLGKDLCILCAPGTTSEAELREAQACYNIGRHLRKMDCAVPHVLGYHEASGLVLFEDLGDLRLHTAVVECRDEETVLEQYYAVVEKLAQMQVEGGKKFDNQWCWDGGRYDKALMLERESGYFLNAFWVGLLGEKPPGGVEEEFQLLADHAAAASTDFFLHRDFQSRNIMLVNDEPRFIDFQGGRFGPLGYDLASLLIDPYTGLNREFQEKVVERYLQALTARIAIEDSKFMEEYRALALQRNLQIIGAFAFLSNVHKKTFFVQFLRPALQSAEHMLEHKMFQDFTQIKNMVAQGLCNV